MTRTQNHQAFQQNLENKKAETLTDFGDTYSSQGHTSTAEEGGLAVVEIFSSMPTIVVDDVITAAVGSVIVIVGSSSTG